MKAVELPITALYCGAEAITPIDPNDLILEYYFDDDTAEKQIDKQHKISDMFHNSFPKCPIVQYRLTMNKKGGNQTLGSALGVVKIDEAKVYLQIMKAGV